VPEASSRACLELDDPATSYLVRDPLGHPPGVEEHERGAMAVHVLGDAADDPPICSAEGHGPQLVVGELEARSSARWCPTSTIAHASEPSGFERSEVLLGSTGSVGS